MIVYSNSYQKYYMMKNVRFTSWSNWMMEGLKENGRDVLKFVFELCSSWKKYS